MSDATADYEAATEPLTRRVHLGLRAGGPDPRDVVALACELFDWSLRTEAVVEVVERNPAEVPPAEMTVLARRILDDIGFDPGFDLAPERLDTLRAALRIVARDLATRGIRGEPEIEVLEDCHPVGAGVRLADGERLDRGGPVPPYLCDDPTTALTGLAVLIQESLLERTWRVWPVCDRHRLGVHGSEWEGAAVWWCAGDGGHALARVGELSRPADATAAAPLPDPRQPPDPEPECTGSVTSVTAVRDLAVSDSSDHRDDIWDLSVLVRARLTP